MILSKSADIIFMAVIKKVGVPSMRGIASRGRANGSLVTMFLVILLAAAAPPNVLRAGAQSDSPRALSAQIKKLIVIGNLDEARSQLGEAIKRYPGVAGFYNLLGVVNAQQGDFATAEKDFRKSIQIDSKLVGGYLNLGHLYQNQMATNSSLRTKAIETYEALLKFRPNNIEGNYQLALLLERNKEFEDSIRYLRQLPMSARMRPQALVLFIADYAGLGLKNEAEAATTKLFASKDLSEADLISLLPGLEAQHDENLEIRLLQELVRRGDASPTDLEELGSLFARQGHLEKARGILEEVAIRSPKPIGALMELAQIAERQEDYKGALGYLARARDLDPNNPSVYFLFGIICVQENLGDEAYKSLRKAVQLNANNPYYNYALGAVILDRENPRGAIPYFNKYSRLRPNDPRGKMGVGLAYFYSHDLDSARKILRSVEYDKETAATAHCFLGHIALLEGNLEQAIKYSELALSEQPHYAEACVVLGQVFMRQNRYTAAEREFHEALDKRPNNYLANLDLLIIFQRTHDPRAKKQAQKVASLKKDRDVMARRMLERIKIVR